MADVHTKKQRSYNMSRIKGKDTKPEMLVRKFLHAKGFRYKLHDKKLPGKPDIVLPKYRTVIFVHGCFWHGHGANLPAGRQGCKYFVVPKTRSKWWTDKIDRNKANDEKAVKALKKDGWRVITVWECKLKPVKIEKTFAFLLERISKFAAMDASDKNKKTAKKRVIAVIDNKVGSYEKHLFFVKKANAAKALLKAVGLPKQLAKAK